MSRQPAGRALGFERCEDRTLTTLVFVLNGNAFHAARPSGLTAGAARVLEKAGHQAIQLSTPDLSTTAGFDRVVRQMAAISHGRPIGIVGFSAGGSLAARLAGSAALRVTAALDYYGPPDLADYLGQHRGDDYGRYVAAHVHFTPDAIDHFSGPIATPAYVVAAFGLGDRNTVADDGATSFARDFPNGRVYAYAGGHGAPIQASPPALADFLAHL